MISSAAVPTLADWAEVFEAAASLFRGKAGSAPPPVSLYPADFMTAVMILLEEEGGYEDDPADPGGATNWGIDSRTYPDVDIRHLTKSQAIDIYYRDWWIGPPPGGRTAQHYDLLPSPIGPKMFDAAVNVGVRQANKFLQRALGVNDDGVIGPITKDAIAAADLDELLQGIRAQQRQFYLDLVEAKPALKKFLNGWLNRAQR